MYDNIFGKHKQKNISQTPVLEVLVKRMRNSIVFKKEKAV